MQFKRLTQAQRNIKRWRERRNHLVCQLLDASPALTRLEALRLANRQMRSK